MSDVGIVGFGRCGRLTAELLLDTHHLFVTDIHDRSREAADLGVRWSDLVTAASQPHVVICVPNRALPGVLDEVASHLRAGATVIDVGSVKVQPMKWMAERVPDGASFVGTHPLFGPDSVRSQGARGQTIVVCPAAGHEEAASEVASAVTGIGLDPVVLPADEHDREMARSQALVFLMARALGRAGLGDASLGTPSERRVFAALRLTAADTEELYEDILRLNPHATEAAETLAGAIREEIDRVLGPGRSALSG